MLGDSLRRHLERKAARSGGSPAGRRRVGQRRWLLWGAVLVAPAVSGYLLATQLLFPKPPVVAEGTPVPQLVGRSLAEARRELAVAALGGLAATELPSADVPAGIVTAQSPLAGQQARPGAPVRVAVSTGQPRVAVPDVRGFAQMRATQLLRGLGFEVMDTVAESLIPAGRVSAVEPGPGTLLQLPATVRLVVSSGPPLASDTMAVDTVGVRYTVGGSRPGRWPLTGPAPIFAPVHRIRESADHGG